MRVLSHPRIPKGGSNPLPPPKKKSNDTLFISYFCINNMYFSACRHTEEINVIASTRSISACWLAGVQDLIKQLSESSQNNLQELV